VPHVPAERARADPGLDEAQHCVLRREFPERIGRRAHCVAELRFGKFPALSQADQQDALGGDARQAAQQQRRAGLARQVAERLAQRAARGLVDAPRRGRKLASGMNADDDAARFRGLGRERLYAKFHSESIA
jgi:hypothetical protein